MSHKSNFITVLQVDERKIARLRAKRSARGVEIVSYDVEQVQDTPVENVLKTFAAKNRLADDPVYSILPRHEITVRILELPSQNIEEIGGMIRLSCDDYVPYPPEELVIDQCILQKMQDGQARVLAAFAHNDVVDAHIRLLQEAGIVPEQVFLSTACLASAVMAVPANKPARFALFNLASGGLEIIAMSGGRLDYGRAIASTLDWTDAGDEARAEQEEELRVELRASLSAYRRESEEGEGVDSIYLCSDLPVDLSAFRDSLSNEITEECIPAPFTSKLATRGADKIPGNAMTALGAALLAQDRGAVAIRLLPAYIVAERQKSATKKKVIAYAALAATVLISFFALYAQAVHQRKGYIRKLEAQISRIEPRAQGIASKQKQLTILKDQVERSQSVIELLAALCDTFPENGVNITRFTYSHRERIELWGRARNNLAVDKLTEDLRALGKSTYRQFARAQQGYTSSTVENTKEVLDYKIVIPFNDGTETMEGDEDLVE